MNCKLFTLLIVSLYFFGCSHSVLDEQLQVAYMAEYEKAKVLQILSPIDKLEHNYLIHGVYDQSVGGDFHFYTNYGVDPIRKDSSMLLGRARTNYLRAKITTYHKLINAKKSCPQWRLQGVSYDNGNYIGHFIDIVASKE